MAFFMPVILLTLVTTDTQTHVQNETSHFSIGKIYLRILFSDAFEGSDSRPRNNDTSWRCCCSALWCCTVSTFDEGHEVGFGHAAILTRTRHLVDINSFLLGQVSNSWSRQGFTTKCGSACGLLITWRRRCNLIFNLFLGSHCVCRGSLLCRLKRMSWFSRINFLAAALLFNLQNDVPHWDNFIVAKVDLSYFSSGSRWNLCNEFVSENLAKVLILYQIRDMTVKAGKMLHTSSTSSPTYTYHSFTVASFVPSPKSGSFTSTCAKCRHSSIYTNAE